jgi:hypothetical protein
MTELREYTAMKYMGDCKCGKCQLVPMAVLVEEIATREALVDTLRAVVRDINDYERANNLAPNPGREECWDSVYRAKVLLGYVKGASNG